MINIFPLYFSMCFFQFHGCEIGYFQENKILIDYIQTYTIYLLYTKRFDKFHIANPFLLLKRDTHKPSLIAAI